MDPPAAPTTGGPKHDDQSAKQFTTNKFLYTLTATEALMLFRNDRVKVEMYARALLSRIEERDNTVKAWAYLDKELVLNQARALDRVPRDQRGPLHGIALAIKDVMNTKDMPTQYGSPLYHNNRSNFDASAVSILRSAGAIIFGKTTTTEFTVLNAGPGTTNPNDVSRTPGGSSAGSAAAVADFQVPLSLGTQTGGSIIRPASYTGIFAMKPTLNAISTEGVKLVSSSIDTCGFFARSVQDLQLLANVFAFKAELTLPRVSLQGTKIALVQTPFWPMAGPGTFDAMLKALKILLGNGVDVEAVVLPAELNDPQLLNRTFTVVVAVEAQTAFLKEYRIDKRNLHPQIRAFVENAPQFTIEQIAEATNRFNEMRAKFDAFAAGYDAIIAPSAQDVAPRGLGGMGDSSFNFLWTGLHAPTIHIPAFEGEQGLPIGLSVVAGRFRDQRLLQVSALLSKPLMAEGGWLMGRLSGLGKLRSR